MLLPAFCVLYRHASQDEELLVKAGRLGFTRGGALRDRGVAGPGDTINIPKGLDRSTVWHSKQRQGQMGRCNGRGSSCYCRPRCLVQAHIQL
jgi:hypothetical protein